MYVWAVKLNINMYENTCNKKKVDLMANILLCKFVFLKITLKYVYFKTVPIKKQ